MNAIFLGVDLSTHDITSSVAPVFGAEYDKLLDYRTDTYFRSQNSGSQTLSFMLSNGSLGVNTVGIIGQNFDEFSGEVVFEGSSTSGFVTSSLLFTFSASSDAQVYTFPEVAFSYYRIRFIDASDSPRISEVYVGKGVQVHSYPPPFSVENIEANTNEGVNLRGTVRTSQRFDPRVRSSVRFDFLTDATRSAFADLAETTRGRTRPLFFRTYEGVTRFVRFAEDYSPGEIRGHNLNAIQVVEMRTQDASGFWNLQGSSVGYPVIGSIPDLKYVISVT
jgi:hypothetical protein